jgi:hypothetical protein
MKDVRLMFNVFSFLMFFSVSSLFSQTSSGWTPIGLTVNGKNMQNGVEAFYQLNKCNNEDVILIKFINYNNSTVIAEWNDGVFTKELKWANNLKKNNKKSLTIGGNEVMQGDCSGKCPPVLVVNVHDFIENIDDIKLFRTLSFHVTVINE